MRSAVSALCVTRIHEAGFVHGDLHSGNVLWTEAGPVLLDLQHARRSRSRRARNRDLGDLDYSLWRHASLADRMRLRAAALGVTPPFDAGRSRGPSRRGQRRERPRGSSRPQSHPPLAASGAALRPSPTGRGRRHAAARASRSRGPPGPRRAPRGAGGRRPARPQERRALSHQRRRGRGTARGGQGGALPRTRPRSSPTWCAARRHGAPGWGGMG